MKIRLLLAALTMSAAALAENSPSLPAAGNVSMPLDEYNKLVGLASKPPKKPDAPPFPYVVKSAQMTLQVDGESLSGAIALDGEVFAAGDRKVPLVTGMIVLDARQKGPQGRNIDLPVQQEAGTLAAVLPGPGEFSLTLQTALPLTIETGRASFSLPVPAAGAVRLTLSVPGEQTLVNLNPGLITGRSSAAGRTTIEATLAPGQTANLWWAARVSAPPVAPKEVRFLSDVKTLISVSQSELAIAALAEITVVQGEPAQFEILPPSGYELTGATGPTLLSSEVQAQAIVLRVSNPTARNHQFLISLVKANTAGKAEIPLVTFQGTQRETGEVLIEGAGAIELNASGIPAGPGGVRRMDVRETSPYLRALARAPIHAAFRYQKRAEPPAVALEWVRFPDSTVLSAVAQKATVTTLITTEGRSLTEIKLWLRNQSQPFLKVGLPAGATILSAEVAGEKVKPVEGADGNRVPLLRPGFRPSDAYEVSFVFLHAGAAFAKKGAAELSLPKMDLPIGLLEWEVFLPQQYKVADFAGDAISARLYPIAAADEEQALPLNGRSQEAILKDLSIDSLAPGQVGGLVTDASGAGVRGARVSVLHLPSGGNYTATADSSGRWLLDQIPSGRVRVMAAAPGFQSTVREFNHDAGRGSRFNMALRVGSVSETVTVAAAAPGVMQESQQVERNARQNAAAPEAASSNVTDLQRRVVGVLPIAVNVPRTGSSYRFLRPLVVDEGTKLTFNYRGR